MTAENNENQTPAPLDFPDQEDTKTMKIRTPEQFHLFDPKRDLIGKDVDIYRVQELIGEGGFSIVFKVFDNNIGTVKAMKLFRVDPISPTSAEDIERLRKEARIASCFNHPNICKVYGLFFLDNKKEIPYVVMDYVEGPSLRSLMQTNPGRLPEAFALAVFIQCAEALSYAFNTPVHFGDSFSSKPYRHITHRDIKPENILVRETGCSIIDFGIAKTHQEEAMAFTQKGMSLGSPPYMSPEAIDGEEVPPEESFRSDLYSLCVVLYEMCEGRTPFKADTVISLTSQIAKQRYDRPTCNPVIASIIRRGLARQYGSYDKVLDEAREALTSFGFKIPSQVFDCYARGKAKGESLQKAMQSIHTPEQKGFSRPILWGSACMAGAILLGIAGYFIFRPAAKAEVSTVRKPVRTAVSPRVAPPAPPPNDPARESVSQTVEKPAPPPSSPVENPLAAAAAGTGPSASAPTGRATGRVPVTKSAAAGNAAAGPAVAPKTDPQISKQKEMEGNKVLYGVIKKEIAAQNYDRALELLSRLNDPAADFQRGIIQMQKSNYIQAVLAFESIRADSRLEPISTKSVGYYRTALCYALLFAQTRKIEYKMEALKRLYDLKQNYVDKIPADLFGRIDAKIKQVESL